MVRHHPSNGLVYQANTAAFYAHPAFRAEVIALLEAQLKEKKGRGGVDHNIYFNLAQLCQQGALPAPKEPASRIRFLKYYGLPANVALPAKVNLPLSYKAIRYFRAAIATSQANDFENGFYSSQLASLLQTLGRNPEALKVCEAALPRADTVSKPDLLVTYGKCLRTAGRFQDAKQVFSQVRSIDDEWNRGPGRSTMQAETQLGLIALAEGDGAKAAKYLWSSVQVQDTNIRARSGLPIGFELARKLLKAGQNKAVAAYCRTILTKFWKGQAETQNLLQLALKAQSTSAG